MARTTEVAEVERLPAGVGLNTVDGAAPESAEADPRPVRNRILASLPPQTWQMVQPMLRPASFRAGMTVLHAGPIRQCLFIESGLVSLQCEPDGMSPVEVGLVGSEGMLGLMAVFGIHDRPHSTLTITDCGAWAIPSSSLLCLCDQDLTLQRAILRYANLRLTEAMKRSACHLQHRLEQRVAGWILGTTDRLDEPRIAVTHKQLAEFLGATRPGVTLAIQELEGRHAIRATRNLISVRSRSMLRELACGCDRWRIDAAAS